MLLSIFALCSACGYQYKELTLDQLEWTCPPCKVHHDRDMNASQNLRTEGLSILNERGIKLIRATDGTPESHPCRDCVIPPSSGATVEDVGISRL